MHYDDLKAVLLFGFRDTCSKKYDETDYMDNMKV